MKIQPFKRVILVTDGLRSSDQVHASALNLAKSHGSHVRIVDTMRPPNAVSRWFSPNASDVFEMVVSDKQKRLHEIADSFREAGVQIETKILFGNSSEAITTEAIRWNADLVIRYMKGFRSKFPGLFGNTARSLMNICPTPILLVGKNTILEPNVLACIDIEHQDEENCAIIAQATRLAGDSEHLLGLYCWEMYGRDILRKRMEQSTFEESLEFAESIYRNAFDKFVESHDTAVFRNGLQLENGEPSKLIPEFCRQENIDVVTMCSAELNHPLKRLFGSTIESVLDHLPCSLLVVKPIGFVSPIETVAEQETLSASDT